MEGLRILWPVLSVILVFVAGVGAVIGTIEGWGLWRGLYFAFITALTIGYGDLVPTHRLTQGLAVVVGFAGITMTGLIAALTVHAFQATRRD
jgi:hypothetical protein